jgi:4-diphosphocytidyl-2-C-methyl-D-erythritol kinase
VSSPVTLDDDAPAKVNLTLRVLGRRADGYHEIESVVAFAGLGDRLSFTAGGELTLAIDGPRATQAGANADNLVLKAARALAQRIPGITLGAFQLDKHLPVAAGLGGGSADAAAALRLLARANDIACDDMRLREAARATGADVPVCLDPRPRLMRGIGEVLSDPLVLPVLHAVLVNPGITLATKDVFAGWTQAGASHLPFDPTAPAKATSYQTFVPLLMTGSNDLEAAAIALAPAIADTLAALRALSGCDLARMSGSGATCFGLFASAAEAMAAAKILQGKYPRWWVHPSALGGAGKLKSAGQ